MKEYNSAKIDPPKVGKKSAKRQDWSDEGTTAATHEGGSEESEDKGLESPGANTHNPKTDEVFAVAGVIEVANRRTAGARNDAERTTA